VQKRGKDPQPKS